MILFGMILFDAKFVRKGRACSALRGAWPQTATRCPVAVSAEGRSGCPPMRNVRNGCG